MVMRGVVGSGAAWQGKGCSMTEEQQYFRRLLADIKAAGINEAQTAEALGVDERTVWRWKVGDRPIGLTAIKLFKLHAQATGTHAITCEAKAA